ncbi:hypothetical protein [Arthrobacter sp. NPDC093139]|uniref:hypothetical protein n=1 Tax=Arthrobacter sp. NPDC093139 TaxID=3363945 RepID=UPI003815E109
MTTTYLPARELLGRIRRTLAHALFSGHFSGSAEEASDALQQVTRWAWLPALSGVAVGAEHARGAHETGRRPRG